MTLTAISSPDTITNNQLPATPPCGLIPPPIGRAKSDTAQSGPRLLAPHYPRAHDEARSLLREALRNPADLQVIDDELHVHINPLSAPRRTRAIAAVCVELNAADTLYPGTQLTLRYSVKEP